MPAPREWRPGARQDDSTPVRYCGRVVRANGSGVSGAQVQLIGLTLEGLPYSPASHIEARVLATGRTDSMGRFDGEVRVNRPHWYYLSVAARGLRRGSSALLRESIVDFGEVRVAPTRVVPIEVVCTPPPAEARPADPGPWSPYVTLDVYWPSTADVGLSSSHWLSHELSEPSSSEGQLVPNFDLRRPTQRSSGVNRFTFDAELPLGTSSLVFGGNCGSAVRELEIAAGRPAPVRVDLPPAGAASLSVHVGEPAPDTTYWLTLWSGPLRESSDPFDDETLMWGIPPGTYHYGRHDDPACQAELTLPPGARVELSLSADSCLLDSRYDLPHRRSDRPLQSLAP